MGGTLATTDTANAFQNAPLSKDQTILVAVTKRLARLGIVEAGRVWEIRTPVYALRESPRLWQEESDK
eukprot:12916842-Prorocentrum_lima.AAC.1